MQELKLGLEVRDLVTGLQGIITRSYHGISGAVQWLVQPKSADSGAIAEGHFLDGHTLEIVGEGVSKLLPEPGYAFPELALGADAKDKYSNFEGVIHARVFEQNGCMNIGLSSKTLSRDGRIVSEYFNATNVELVKAPEKEVERLKTGPVMMKGSQIPRPK